MKSKKKRGKNFISNNYLKCWRFIKESRNFIFIAIGIFLAFFIVGFFVPLPNSISEQLMNYLKEIVAQLQGRSGFQIISFIFFNNAKTSFFGIFLGIFLGIFPVAISVFNGYLLGFVSRLSVNADGFLSLWRLLPHGIFELPAVFISLGLGIKLGAVLLKDHKRFKESFYDSIRVFVSVVLPLLIIAAIIEGTLIYFSGK